MHTILNDKPTQTTATARAGRDRRSSDPVDQLSRQLELSCANAVNAQQLAARLEAAGINDRVAFERYGYHDVFSLAEELYYRVPLRALAPGAGQRNAYSWRETMRGVLFALPGAFYPVLFNLSDTRTVAFALTIGMMFAWVWSQGMTRLAYLLQGRTIAPEPFLQRALLAGITSMLIIGCTLELLWPKNGTVISLATAQVTLQLCTAVFMILERHNGLLRAFVPGLLLSATHLLIGIDHRIVLAGIATSVVMTLMCALNVTRASARPNTKKKVRSGRFSSQDWLDTVPYIMYGLLGATFVCFHSFALIMIAPQNAASLGLVILPLVLVSGMLEAELRRFRDKGRAALASVNTTRAFISGIQRTYWTGLARYTSILAALSALLYFLGHHAQLVPAQSPMMLLAFLALGPAFYSSSLLIAQGAVRRVLACICAALTVHGLTTALIYQPHVADLETSYLISCVIYAVLAVLSAKASVVEVSHYR